MSLVSKIKKAIADYEIRRELDLVSKLKLDKENLFKHYTVTLPKTLSSEEIKNILKSVENKGHINHHSLPSWEKIYDHFKFIYPLNKE